jgi:hypothetical protein
MKFWLETYSVSEKKTRLSDTTVAYEQQLKEIVAIETLSETISC